MTSEPSLAGQTIAITGATSGIGRAAAVALARNGARIIALVRDTSRGEGLRREVAALTGDETRLSVIECDLASFDSVRAAAAWVRSQAERLDVLINNAGLIAPTRRVTVDGHELTMQVNHLSHHLLTAELMPVMAATGARIVTVSSDAHFAAWRGLDFDDLEIEKRWTSFGAYARSKLANIMFAYELARRLEGTRITSNVMHPGVVSTGFGREGWGAQGWLWDYFVPKLTPEQGADTVVFLATSPAVAGVSGRYWYRRKPKRSSPVSRDARAWSRLWEWTESVTGAPRAHA